MERLRNELKSRAEADEAARKLQEQEVRQCLRLAARRRSDARLRLAWMDAPPQRNKAEVAAMIPAIGFDLGRDAVPLANQLLFGSTLGI